MRLSCRIGLLGFSITALVISGCSLRKLTLHEEIHSVGRFEFRQAADDLAGVVIGAPHGKTDRDSDRLAKAFSDLTGAGLVTAYGFRAQRLSVSQPVVWLYTFPAPADLLRQRSIFNDYRRLLCRAAGGSMDLYIGIHRSKEKEVSDRIEVATSGLTFEEARALKDSYNQIRDQLTEGRQVSNLIMAIEPLDRIYWRVSGEKHHGILLTAAKGLNLRVPELLSSEPAEELYTEILSRWIDRAITLLRENPLRLPQIQVKLTDLGKFELVKSRKRIWGTVIGAPHGSYDEYTAEMATRVSYRTGIAAVIAKGFTPMEAGGWRINVNRPTEKTPYSEGPELHSRRAGEIYQAYKELVFAASRENLSLYVDLHQYSTDSKIQVATVGISRREARIIKMLYREIRDRILRNRLEGTPAVELVIEPLEAIEIGAWAAKAEGILGLARRSMHFELPGQEILATPEARESYTRILAALLQEAVPFLLSRESGATK